MAAMEACLAARRVIAASPEPPKSAAELMAEQMKAAVAAPPPVSSTGPAAGNGKEVLLQVGAGDREPGLQGGYRADHTVYAVLLLTACWLVDAVCSCNVTSCVASLQAQQRS